MIVAVMTRVIALFGHIATIVTWILIVATVVATKDDLTEQGEAK